MTTPSPSGDHGAIVVTSAVPDTLPPSANGWGNRPHLDGLRAVAVYLVVWFHARGELGSGGFIGVDLFFVLSGFLVTNVLLSDLATFGRVRLGRFYARRVRRLVPAAFLAVVGISAAALVITTPLDRADLVTDARAASLWFANWHFIDQVANYFNSTDLESPFLHFWSLAIEEQFYVAYPLALVGIVALARRNVGRMAALLAVATISLASWQVWVARLDDNRAYLGTDTRVYQLLAGATVAVVLWRVAVGVRARRLARWVLPMALVVFVVLSSSLVDVSASTRGLLAALVAAIVIASSEAARDGTAIALLSRPTLRHLGEISYGTYLWHWPVVILTERVVEVSPGPMFVLAATLGTGLAALSHRLVEAPIRTGSLQGHPWASLAGGVTLAVVAGLVAAPLLLDGGTRQLVRATNVATPAIGGGPSWLSDPVPELDWAAVLDDVPPRPRCLRPDGSDCILVEGDGPTIFLVGDSHARMYVPAFLALARRHGLRLALSATGACPWPATAFRGAATRPTSRTCIRKRSLVYDQQVPALDPEFVVLSSATPAYSDHQMRSSDPALDALGYPTLLEPLVEATVQDLAGEGREVVLILPAPELAADPLRCLSGARVLGECAIPRLPPAPERAVYEQAARRPGVHVLDLDRALCPAPEGCPPIVDGLVVRRDPAHLAAAFAASLGPDVEQAFDDAGLLDAG